MKNVAKTIGGSKISKRRGHNNKGLDLRPLGFPWARMIFLSKSSQDSHERGWRRYGGLNNNIFLEGVTFNNNIPVRNSNALSAYAPVRPRIDENCAESIQDDDAIVKTLTTTISVDDRPNIYQRFLRGS